MCVAIDRFGDEVGCAVDGERNGRGDPVAGEVEGEAMELVLERRRFDGPLRSGQARAVEEDDRRPAIISRGIAVASVTPAGRIDRQFTSFRSTA